MNPDSFLLTAVVTASDLAPRCLGHMRGLSGEKDEGVSGWPRRRQENKRTEECVDEQESTAARNTLTDDRQRPSAAFSMYRWQMCAKLTSGRAFRRFVVASAHWRDAGMSAPNSITKMGTDAS